MKRRNLLYSTVGVGVSMIGAFGWHITSQEETEEVVTESDLPEGSNLELARSFAKEIKTYFPSASIYITDDATVAMRYETDTESKSELETELYTIADKFASHASEHGSDTLTILVDKVQMIVPEPTVKAYTEDEINQEAFFKTLEIKGTEYND